MSDSVWLEKGVSFNPTYILRVQHSLSSHPLLQLPRLQMLAESLAGTDHIKFVLPNRKEASAFYTISEREAKRNVGEVFQRIEEKGSWVAIYFAEADPDYRKLIDEALNSLAPTVEPTDPGMSGYSLFIFVASPPTITPFHFDRENNFNLQILGRKHLRVWPMNDREAVPEEAIENYFTHNSLSGLRYHDDLESRAKHFDVGPGDGLYVPCTSAHFVATEEYWATPGNSVSISIALTYFTRATRIRANAYLCNEFLRKHFSVNPTPPGRSPFLDSVKYPVARALIKSRQMLRNASIPRGL